MPFLPQPDHQARRRILDGQAGAAEDDLQHVKLDAGTGCSQLARRRPQPALALAGGGQLREQVGDVGWQLGQTRARCAPSGNVTSLHRYWSTRTKCDLPLP